MRRKINQIDATDGIMPDHDCKIHRCTAYNIIAFLTFVCQQFAKNVFGVLQSIKIREEGGTRQQASEVAAPTSTANSQASVSISLLQGQVPL